MTKAANRKDWSSASFTCRRLEITDAHIAKIKEKSRVTLTGRDREMFQDVMNYCLIHGGLQRDAPYRREIEKALISAQKSVGDVFRTFDEKNDRGVLAARHKIEDELVTMPGNPEPHQLLIKLLPLKVAINNAIENFNRQDIIKETGRDVDEVANFFLLEMDKLFKHAKGKAPYREIFFRCALEIFSKPDRPIQLNPWNWGNLKQRITRLRKSSKK